MFGYFSKICREIQVSLKSDKNNEYLHKDQYTFLITSRSVLRGMRNVSDSRCREYQNILPFMI